MKKLQPYFLPVTFLIAALSMAGSLYFSEVLHLAPCVLCWYQRITMYPLVAISLVAMLRKDKKAWEYILPFALIGLGIATYHVILYYGVNWGFHPEWQGPCQNGISCTTRYIEWFGFITIPLLSWTAHLTISVMMGLAWWIDRKPVSS
jgi:disulfide bond formation protein DsbB